MVGSWGRGRRRRGESRKLSLTHQPDTAGERDFSTPWMSSGEAGGEQAKPGGFSSCSSRMAEQKEAE
jgi:hypothetical protein